MKRFSAILIVLITCLITFSSCDDDSIFYPKVTTANGTTTVSGIRPGGLERALFIRLGSVSHLIINDTIDARDFATMRDQMPGLTTIDLSNAVIAAYNGFEGSAGNRLYYYKANILPAFAFYSPVTSTAKIKLTAVLLPHTITSIGDYAFNGCSGLTGTLEIPASVTDTIGKSAFSFCENITGISLSGAKYIGESAFQGCSKLSGTVLIPEATQEIKTWAFSYCPNIGTVSIPSTVSTIEKAAFTGAATSFTVAASNTSFSAQDGVLFNQDKSILIQYPATKTGVYNVPSGVNTIGPYAFANCTGLTGITFPASLSMIEDYAFSACTNLSGSFPISSGISSIGQYVFDNCNHITDFDIASGNTTYSLSDGLLMDISIMIVKRCITTKTGNCVIPSVTLFIDNAAFSDCTGLTSVTIPDGILYIGHRAFYNCTGLQRVYANASTPVDLTYSLSALDGINFTHCSLYVPTGAKSTYKAAIGWKSFHRIIEN